MRKILLSLMALLAVSACQTTGGFDAGRNRAEHAVLIMAEDADPGSLSRNSRVSRRVMDAFATQISAYGFSVFDEAALTFATHDPRRARRSDA